VRALRKKLLRDLWRLRVPCLTIALLVGSGIASFVTAVASAASMKASRDAFYAEGRIGDVFAQLVRAPRSLLERVRELPGVAAVEGRVIDDCRVVVEGGSEPVVARFVSAPPGEGHLDTLTILRGRRPLPGSPDEVVLSEVFASTWGLEPGSRLGAVVEGRALSLRVVGTGVSPVYVFPMGRTGLSDPRHFGIVWMDDGSLAKGAGYDGAFDDLVAELEPGADRREVMRRVDDLLEPYGGLGAVAREDAPSPHVVDQKIQGMVRLSRTLPAIFLGVAAFLLNVLLVRLVTTQREQTATLKALGYGTGELVMHYLGFATAICAAGAVLGVGLGALGARAMVALYARYFVFPVFVFRMEAWAVGVATLLAFAAGLGGTLRAVLRAVSIPAAEAMRPPAPASQHRTFLDRLPVRVPAVVRMVARDIERRPGRLLLSSASIALATGIVLAGSALGDSMEEVLRLQFEVSRREDVSVTLVHARPWRAVREAAHLPGVLAAEGLRVVPVRLRSATRERTSAILGLPEAMRLRHLLDAERHEIPLPAGLSLSRILAERLAVHPGDRLEVEVLEGERQRLEIPVSGLVDDLFGMSGYMDATTVSRMLGEAPQVDQILVQASPGALDVAELGLDRLPMTGYVSRPELERGLLHAEIADVFTSMSVVLALFAAVIAVGVVYNNARIALETRSRDLATMRILGFTRAELAAVLLGEQSVQIVLGVLPGLALGRALGQLWLSTIDPEMLRVPTILHPSSYAAAACVVGAAAVVSALIVRRRSDRLDLVSVLKARD